MVHRSGAGPKGCPITDLTVDRLVQSFEVMRHPDTIASAKALGAKMSKEDGVSEGVKSFYNNLPLGDMICEVCIFNNRRQAVARIYCGDCGLKLSEEADTIIHRTTGGRAHHERVPYRPSKWGVVSPTNILEGINQGVNVAAYELAGGLYDLFAKPVEGAAKDGIIGQ